jgi:hypothetical protein
MLFIHVDNFFKKIEKIIQKMKEDNEIIKIKIKKLKGSY